MTFTHALSTNNYGSAKFIVDASAANGTHTTIASALTSASSGDTIFIRPGTYTENLTLKAGVNLSAYNCDAFNNVIISGNATLSTAGTVNISGIRLQTNSAALITVSGSVASILNLTNCYLNCTNNSGITFSSSSSSARIHIYNSQGDLGTTGIALFSVTSAGELRFVNSSFTNTGGSSTANTVSSGTFSSLYSNLSNPVTSSSTGSVVQFCSTIDTTAQNVTALTVGGSGNHSATYTSYASGSASTISISTSINTVFISVVSSNTNAITGAGILVNGGVSLPGTSQLINTTTQTARVFLAGGISFNGGTNVLSNYTEGTFTSTLFGSTTAGTTTYTTQTGFYRRIGNLAVVQGVAIGTAATGTGNATIGGLPFTIKNQTAGNAYGTLLTSNAAGWAWPAGTTSIFLAGSVNTITGVIQASGTGAGFGSLQMNNSAFNFQYTLSHEI